MDMVSGKLFGRILAILGMFLIGCQSGRGSDRSTVTHSELGGSPVKTVIQGTNTPAKTIHTPTVAIGDNGVGIASATWTPNPFLEQTATSSPTATTSLWRIDSPDYFLFHEAGLSIRQPEIYMLRPGEPESQFIAYGDLINGQPWSPNGMQLVFENQTGSQESESTKQFAIADLGTGEVSTIDLNDPRPNIFWSPDGKYLLYEARHQQDNLAQIVLYEISEGTNEVLLEIPDLFLLSGWSFDSQKIAFVARINGQYDLYTLEPNTLHMEQLTDSHDIETTAVWSPIGLELVFGTSIFSEPLLLDGGPHYVNSLYLNDISDPNNRFLGNYNAILRESLSWSPDGSNIAYSEAGTLCILDIENDLTECPLEGIESSNIEHAAVEVPPAWSPDGNWLAFRASGSTQCPVIYFLELQTGNLIPADLERCRTSPIYWFPAIIGGSG